ncbi:MAG: ABC transporter permease [Acidobacteria bacterium]|nr:ABC transporter permease [Acidobacteriota bacterium]
MVDLGFRMLLHDRTRFTITVSGVAFAVCLVLAQVGLFNGLMDNAALTIRKSSADLWVTSRNTANVDFPQTFPENRVDRVRSVPGVARADNLIVAYLNLALPSGAQESTIAYALKDFKAWNLPWAMKEGQVEDLRRGRNLIIDDKAQRRFGAFRTGEYREVLETRMKIVGQSTGALSFTTTPISFLDYDLAQSLQPTLLGGRTTYTLVKLAPGADPQAVKAEIQRRLPYNDVHTRDAWAAKSESYWIVNTGLGMNAYLTVFLGCLVALVVVAQTLYTSTMEHLREFGTVKAIGGSNWDIYAILARQASLAAAVGFVLGAGMAYALVPLAARADLKLLMPLPFVAVTALGTLALCLGAAMLSFRKVAGIDPGLVFRS